MKKNVRASVLVLLLFSIAVSSCQDSSDVAIQADAQNDFNSNQEIFVQDFVFNGQTYRLSHYIEGDTTKKFVENEDYLTFTNQLDGELKSIHLKVDENGDAQYFIYDTTEELFADNPGLKESIHRAVEQPSTALREDEHSHEAEGSTSGRIATHPYARVIAFDHKNYGGATRFHVDCFGVGSCYFTNIGVNCSQGHNPPASCKDNDISSLRITNRLGSGTSVRQFIFCDNINCGPFAPYFIVTLPSYICGICIPNWFYNELDLNVLQNTNTPGGLTGYTSLNWRNRISAILMPGQ